MDEDPKLTVAMRGPLGAARRRVEDCAPQAELERFFLEDPGAREAPWGFFVVWKRDGSDSSAAQRRIPFLLVAVGQSPVQQWSDGYHQVFSPLRGVLEEREDGSVELLVHQPQERPNAVTSDFMPDMSEIACKLQLLMQHLAVDHVVASTAKAS
jgi:hypothetical protein